MKTIAMKEILENSNDFQEKYALYGTRQFEESMLQCFNYIWRKFHNNQIAYDTEDGFLSDFYNTFDSEYYVFIKMQETYEKLISLSDDDILFERQSIVNYAMADNSATENMPLENVLPYITNQTSSRTRENVAIQYKVYLDGIHRNYIELFLDKFKYLFLKIFVEEEYYGY